MDNHVMYYACAKGTLEIRRCLLCTKVILAKPCKCELGINCYKFECDQYNPVGKAGISQRIESLLELNQADG